MSVPLLVMGTTGRIGGALRQNGAPQLRPIWQARDARPGFLHWDILAGPCPDAAASGVVLCMAGVIRGDAAQLDHNSALGLAACNAAIDQGARHVFLASSAAVYGASDGVLAEDAVPAPMGAYGAAKLAMERAAMGRMQGAAPGITLLRIGNIAGFDALLGNVRHGLTAQLDPVAGQAGPVRSYIGPATLARVLVQLAGLAARDVPLPPVLNIAAATVAMGDLLDAAGADWRFGPQNPAVIPRVELDITRLRSLVDLPAHAGQAAAMVAEWRGMAT
ncbi:NAD dependent epimerase/dehydratase family protein [Pseudorhodobacter antarcticus]|uniref:NAD dependent epimerase/dehydratase family protein n=1 Tax=Pseudorhodobacter antarcticus TaxID=1077947 RepID=A0A1H8C404_9RHOB|nr:NAD-dependent epimerase/dehydratase family protein [Pseudorhodobacter antarcticus]SEM89805.1 NAD dependent epimerase/dehydratase family protein [Pseudorhodobacter antarcticus]